MQALKSQPNGRIKLLEMITKRFSLIKSFPELRKMATRFHRELGTFFPIKNIITTNWDTFFEEECKATPFVFDQDIAFWEAAKRRVLKIHGSETNFGSIIADADDYKKCTKNLSKGIIGSKLKDILATQTIIFIGYSLSDYDFNSIYTFVRKQMRGLHKQAYIVTPFENEIEKFRKIGLIPIITDGTYFIKKLKQHPKIASHFIKDSFIEFSARLLYKTNIQHNRLHSEINFLNQPDAIYSACYQDGLKHSLERAINMSGNSEYSHACELKEIINKYEDIKNKIINRGIFEDIAYIEGYINGLVAIYEHEKFTENDIPMYFHFSESENSPSITDIEHYKEKIHSLTKNDESYRHAEKVVQRLKENPLLEYHHPPWL